MFVMPGLQYAAFVIYYAEQSSRQQNSLNATTTCFSVRTKLTRSSSETSSRVLSFLTPTTADEKNRTKSSPQWNDIGRCEKAKVTTVLLCDERALSLDKTTCAAL